jgi:hypothetical protein
MDAPQRQGLLTNDKKYSINKVKTRTMWMLLGQRRALHTNVLFLEFTGQVTLKIGGDQDAIGKR